jgi:signal transduction histidine kinase
MNETSENLNTNDLNALILAPFGQDGKLARNVLENAGIKSENLLSLERLAERLKFSAGCLLIAEEAITENALRLLTLRLSEQEAWSDLPIILLSSENKKFEHTRKIVEHFGNVANITLLERPFSVITLVTMTKVALRARQKQFQVRDLLTKMNHTLSIRDEFLSIASHELKTPITTIRLQTQMKTRLIKRGDLSSLTPERTTKFIEIIDKQSQRISRLVDDMLDITRIENGRLTIKPDLFDLNSVVAQVLEAFQGEFESKKITVEFHEDGQLMGYWDQYRIEQVVVNLITNAIKYGSSRPVSLKTFRENEMAVLTVKDQGLGISPQDKERIFDRFERAVSGGNISGLGLGLFISRQIVELHDGALTVISEPDNGSEFKLELPLQKEIR